ncbi:PREDICTED: uncharacterized protein K02A2.6-like [Priapulus caudatus]|uniref:Uncharacterized protein K02A2.6-like n=1 Tax=Priapulus caudatus TaxID=37621 RepID=A0ABM1EYS5_PRICU|nr:PREDICTED: uncharacterized protein K02A2.6-like [Priapulus caudatus]
MEEYINHIAATSAPKAMTLTELHNCTERDATLQAVIHAIRFGKWEIAKQRPGVNTASFDRIHKVPGMGTHFMVISNDFLRYVVMEPVSSLTANTVIPVIDKIIGEFGVPDVVKSDNGSPFNSSAFSDYARHKGVKHRNITPLWPLANAEAERFMKTVKKSIKAAIAEGKS